MKRRDDGHSAEFMGASSRARDVARHRAWRLWLIVLLSFGLHGPLAAQEEKAPAPVQLPTTIDATVADILATMSQENKEKLREMKRDDLIKLHFGLGLHIRNHYGLWGRNMPLLEAGCQIVPAPCHPDDVSGAIIERVWQAVRK